MVLLWLSRFLESLGVNKLNNLGSMFGQSFSVGIIINSDWDIMYYMCQWLNLYAILIFMLAVYLYFSIISIMNKISASIKWNKAKYENIFLSNIIWQTQFCISNRKWDVGNQTASRSAGEIRKIVLDIVLSLNSKIPNT